MTAQVGESSEIISVSQRPNQQDSQLNRLSVLRFSPEQVLGDHALALAARQLRASVYIDERGFLPASAREADGGERDADDARSLHFLALSENAQGDTDVVGTMRLIHKQSGADLLPIESFFPEHFENNPVPENGFEVSRLVVESRQNRVANKLASFSLIYAGLTHALNESWSPCFAVLESPLERRLQNMGVKTDRVTATQWIEQYSTHNIAVEIDLSQTKRGMDTLRGAI